MVLVLGEGIRVTDSQWVTWSSQLASAVATVSLTLDELSVGTRSLYIGANRGRGQI
jgi:hypothetical protein